MNTPLIDRDRFVMGDVSAHIGFLNCERIADRRDIHRWSVEAHFHEGLSQLFIFSQGGIEARIDYRPVTLAEPAVVWLPALCNHAFTYPEGLHGWVITVPTGDVSRLAAENPWLASWIGSAQVLPLSDAAEAVTGCLDLAPRIEAEMAQPDADRHAGLKALFLLQLLALHRGLLQAQQRHTPQQNAQDGNRPADRHRDLVGRFQELLDRHWSETRAVVDYADMLSVTPTHLSRCVKTALGRTAGAVIADRVMLAAKRRLVFTDSPVAEIAYDLDFSSPSYFTRFFTQQAGEAPRAFRRRMRNLA